MKIKRILTILGAVVILVLSCLGGIRVKAYKDALAAAKAGERELAVTVQTGKVERSRIDNVFTFNGDIEALRSVDLKPKISGRLIALELEDGTPVEEGVHVRKGQLIGRIDDREYKAQLSNAKAVREQRLADKKSAQAEAEFAEISVRDKKREFARQQNLLANKATTQQTYDLAETELKQAEVNLARYMANIQEAEAGLQQATASLELAEVNLSETRLYSPMNGVISKKSMDPGSMVSPSSEIVTILDMEEVKVLLSVPMNYLARVNPGKTHAALRTASMPGHSIKCTLAKIYPAVNVETRTARVELRIKNELDRRNEYMLKAGMYATVDVTIESKEDVLYIPSSLPIRNLSRNIVYRVDGDKAVAVDVKLGVRFADKVEVVSGLNEGDEIVIVGQHRLTDGCAIKKLAGNNLAF